MLKLGALMATVHGTDTIYDMLECGDDMQFAICTHAILLFMCQQNKQTHPTQRFRNKKLDKHNYAVLSELVCLCLLKSLCDPC